MTERRPKYDNNLTLYNSGAVKAMLLLFVILYHSCRFYTGEWFTKDPSEVIPRLYLFTRWLDSFHIYAFTMVSGYIYYYVKYANGGGVRQLSSVLKK